MSASCIPDTARPRQPCPFLWLRLEQEAYCLSCLKGSRRKVRRNLAPSALTITKPIGTELRLQANMFNCPPYSLHHHYLPPSHCHRSPRRLQPPPNRLIHPPTAASLQFLTPQPGRSWLTTNLMVPPAIYSSTAPLPTGGLAHTALPGLPRVLSSQSPLFEATFPDLSAWENEPLVSSGALLRVGTANILCVSTPFVPVSPHALPLLPAEKLHQHRASFFFSPLHPRAEHTASQSIHSHEIFTKPDVGE